MREEKIVSLLLIGLLTLILGVISYFCYQRKIENKERELIKIEKKITLIQRLLKLEKDWNKETEIYLCANIASLKKTIEEIAKSMKIRSLKVLGTQRRKYSFHKRILLE
ncbi:MAG: hypothetical protein DRP76_04755, partial [Candidatus Omnitrophota bacterium]